MGKIHWGRSRCVKSKRRWRKIDCASSLCDLGHPCVYNAVVLGGWEEEAVVRTVTGWEEEVVVRTLTGSDSLTRYSFGA